MSAPLSEAERVLLEAELAAAQAKAAVISRRLGEAGEQESPPVPARKIRHRKQTVKPPAPEELPESNVRSLETARLQAMAERKGWHAGDAS